MSHLKGKRVVVTGGGTGIGRSTAIELAAAGCRVAIAGRREAPLVETAGLFDGDPGIIHRSCDVTNRRDVDACFEWVRAEMGGVDILVQSAGRNVPHRRMDDTTPEDWERIVSVNATGAFHCMQAVLPGMREQRDGLIVLINSTSGVRSHPLGGVAYCASKFAMSALGRLAGHETRDEGVRVTNLYPGEVETPILDNRPVPVTAEHRARILQPEDVAAMVVAVARLPPRASVPELVLKPTIQEFI